MLRIGFIGCGGIARHHATGMQQLKSARIVAASDVVEAAAQSFAKDFGGTPYTDYRKLLKQADVDAVWVCTPTFQHPAPVIAAAKASKHIFCEKPMALKLAEAESMAEAAAKAKVRFTIGFVRRFDTQWGTLRKVVQSGALGWPVIWRFAAGGRPANPWFRDVHKGGGPLMDGAIHNYDFMLQIFGPVASVQASSLQFDKTSVGADTASVIVNFKSGDQHSLIWSWGVAAGAPVTYLNDLIGPKGALQFGMTAAQAPKGFDPQKQGALTLKTGQGRERVYTYPQRDMFLEQLKHVVGCFARGEQPLVKAEDGLKSLKVAVAVLKAGASRGTVKV
ncbi:MAG: Gfo/Idh/MocA family oxidoreductase [Candidatus Handelsmanbacteria bacterium]|nr:Gfo/Idh/MocA family oxidoreductase [Candidatus Handelsmanbacteria bacterium]